VWVSHPRIGDLPELALVGAALRLLVAFLLAGVALLRLILAAGAGRLLVLLLVLLLTLLARRARTLLSHWFLLCWNLSNLTQPLQAVKSLGKKIPPIFRLVVCLASLHSGRLFLLQERLLRSELFRPDCRGDVPVDAWSALG